jgi:hypothetical protein
MRLIKKSTKESKKRYSSKKCYPLFAKKELLFIYLGTIHKRRLIKGAGLSFLRKKTYLSTLSCVFRLVWVPMTTTQALSIHKISFIQMQLGKHPLIFCVLVIGSVVMSPSRAGSS